MEHSTQWTQVPLPRGVTPSERNGHTVVEYNGTFYLFGGFDGTNVFDELYAFRDGVWFLLPRTGNLPSGRSLHTAVIFEDAMYIFGGVGSRSQTTGIFGLGRAQSTQVILNSIERFDFLTQTWSSVADYAEPKPEPRDGHIAVVYRDSMYVFGGSNDVRVYNDFWQFSFRYSRWVPITNVPLDARRMHCGLFVPPYTLKTIPTEQPNENQNQNLNPTPQSKVTNPSLFILGGYDGRDNYPTYLIAYDFERGAWNPVPTTGGMPPRLGYGHSAVLHKNVIYVFGGYGSGSGYRKTLHKFYLEKSEWAQVQEEEGQAWPVARRRHAAVVSKDGKHMYIFAGGSGRYFNDIWKYDLSVEGKEEFFTKGFQLLKDDMLKLLHQSDEENKMYSDISFIVEGKALHAHKAILSARSEHFKRLFQTPMKESSGEVEVGETRYEVFRVLLEYLYTGDDKLITPETSVELLSLSEQYLLPHLKGLCEEIAIHHIDKENAAFLLRTADLYSCEKLRKVAIKFCGKNHAQILASGALKDFPQNLLLEIITAISNPSPSSSSSSS
eukprot:TRINITY_DN2109_c0_g1_i4.p1 TRINITY_DN2109_c0_g1~~TRINITY_DN2109_c0_g1_i4.p1  ORF type:complete len:553 (-),score=112.31 TRINITY_DN2109_c0_g1_i4:287-1945(-)